MSYTYDACIVPEVAKRVLTAYSGVKVARLPRKSGFYLLNVDNVVASDSERREAHFEQVCERTTHNLGVRAGDAESALGPG